jgi:beta-glucosidase
MKTLLIIASSIIIISCTDLRNAGSDADIKLDEMLIQLPVREKSVLLGAKNGNSLYGIEPYNIPEVKIGHGVMGITNHQNNTSFPSPLALACTWNKSLAYQQGIALGKEAKNQKIGIIFAPSANLYRIPQYGRNFENYGEDPCLSAALIVPFIKGVQSQHVLSALHYVGCYNQEYNHNINNIVIDERTLHELYLYPFRQAIQKAHAGAIVMAPNMLNQKYCSENQTLINDIIRDQYEFNGIIFSDYYSTFSPEIINAGIDIELPEAEYMRYPYIRALIARGKLAISDVDEKVETVISTLQANGVYSASDKPMQTNDFYEHQIIARQIARESFVLLKNKQNILPLKNTENCSIAVYSINGKHLPLSGSGNLFSEKWKKKDLAAVLQNKTNAKGTFVKAFTLEPDKEEILSTIDYFQPDTDLAGVEMRIYDEANFSTDPVIEKIDSNIEATYNDIEQIEDNEYWVEWKATLRPDDSGEYTFMLETNNQCNVYINNQILLLGYKRKPSVIQQENMQLQAEQTYDLRIVQRMNKNTSIRFGYKQKHSNRIQTLAKEAGNYDYAIVCAGFNEHSEGEGRDRPYALPVNQQKLIREVAKNNPHTIVLITAGGSVEMAGWISDIKGLIYSSYQGENGAHSLSEILLGEINPSGRLPFTIEQQWSDAVGYYSYDTADANTAASVFHLNHKPKPYHTLEYAEGIYTGYRHFDRNAIDPLFPFGYGLSYTRFDYQDIKISQNVMGPNEKAVVTVSLKNTGDMAGQETVQLYIQDVVSSEERPVKELKDFDKVMLQPGEIKNVNFTIDQEKLAFFHSESNEWTAETGEFIVLVGSSANNIRLSETIKLE